MNDYLERMTELSRELGEIWSRLFDHRPFLNGEIKYMLKEFEVIMHVIGDKSGFVPPITIQNKMVIEPRTTDKKEKRGDREVENWFAILEKFAEVKDVELVTIKKSAEVGLPVLKEKLDQAIQLFDEVETDYLETRKVFQKKREENKEKRQKEWDQFIDDMNFKCQRIDNAFEEKEEELRDLYADLNHKLNIADN